MDFQVREDEKKYYIVPLKMTGRNLGKIQYEIDRKMLQKVE